MHKRILEIRETSTVTATEAAAKHFGLTFRHARNGLDTEYVIEGPDHLAQTINTLVEKVDYIEGATL